jgi:hypothetical protein
MGAVMDQKAKRRPRSWLGAIDVVLRLMLASQFLLLPLPLIYPGSLDVGSVRVGDFYTPPLPPSPWPDLNAGAVELSLGAYGWQEHLLYAAAHGLAFGLVSIPALFYAIRLVTAVRARGPFTAETVRRLRVLGALVLIGGLAATLISMVAAFVLLDLALPVEDAMVEAFAQPNYEVWIWWLPLGFALFGFAEITKWGHHMRADLDGVV